MKKIQTKHLFDKRINDYQVATKQLGKVAYVNLDNAATTPPFKEVESGVAEYLRSYGSVHRGAGIKSKVSTDIYEKSREVIKDFVHAPKDSYVIFTGNTTGAINNLAYFFSFLKGKIAVSEIEHSSSWLPWLKTEGITSLEGKRVKEEGLDEINEKIQEYGKKQVLRYKVNSKFEFDLKEIEKLLKNNKIKAFILTASSNVTGYCPDITKIGKIVHKYSAYFIVDGCQYIQHHEVNMQKMGIDFLVASGHKFYAPYGGGFLIGPKKFLDKFLPYQIGGGNLPYITVSGEFLRYKNQMAHDPGTPNAVGAIGMAIALRKLKKIGIKNVESYERKLTNLAFEALRKNPKVILYVDKKHLNSIIPFNIKECSSVSVAERLNNDFGIGVRAGSFCAYSAIRKLIGTKDESQIVKKVLEGDTSEVPSIVRASFSLCNSRQDINRFVKAIKFITR